MTFTDVHKLGTILENKVVQKLKFSKMTIVKNFFINIEYQVVENAPSEKISLNFATTGLEQKRKEKLN